MMLICLPLNYMTNHSRLSPWRLSPNYRANHNSSNRTKWFDLLKNWISMWGIFKIASWPTTCLVKFIWSQKELSKYYQLSMPKNQNFTDLATNGFLHKEGKFQFEGWKKGSVRWTKPQIEKLIHKWLIKKKGLNFYGENDGTVILYFVHHFLFLCKIFHRLKQCLLLCY